LRSSLECRLLLQGRLTASQIALDAGFAHQSHMAHWMGRLLGMTPRELAKSAGRPGPQTRDAR